MSARFVDRTVRYCSFCQGAASRPGVDTHEAHGCRGEDVPTIALGPSKISAAAQAEAARKQLAAWTVKAEAQRRGWLVRDYRSTRRAVRTWGVPTLITAGFSLWRLRLRARRKRAAAKTA